MTGSDCLSLYPQPLTQSSQQPDDMGPVLPFSGEETEAWRMKGQSQAWSPGVMALTSRLGCLLCEKLL